MANAIGRTSAVYPSPSNPLNVAISLDVAYVGNDLPPEYHGGFTVGLYIEFPGDAQPAAIRTTMSSAVSNYAQASGFTVPGGNMVLPTFQKG